MINKEEVKKAEKNFKISKNLFYNKLKSYNFIKSKDDGLHKDYYLNIIFANKELEVLKRNCVYWAQRLNFLKKSNSSLH